MLGTDPGAWAKLYRQDPVQALELALQEQGDRVLRLVYLRLGDRRAAERVAEETFLHAARLGRAARTSCSLGAWLACLALGLSRSAVTRRGVQCRSGPHAAPTSEQRLLDEMRGLPCRSAELLLLHYWSGYSVEEIATVWGVHPATVRAGLTFSLSLLRRGLARSVRSGPGGPHGAGDENGFLQRDRSFEKERGVGVGPE
ncbi:MAG: sigma-70 family RNA polymerase sigma factor [Bacillota bacterium]